MSGTRFDDLTIHGAAYEVGVSDDRKAFTTTFSDVQIEVGNDDSAASTVAGRLVQVGLPLIDAEADPPINLSISGYAVVQERASAWLCVRVGGDTRIIDFPVGTDRSFIVQVTHSPIGAESEIALSVCAVVERDGRDGGLALLTITTIDGDIRVRHSQQAQALQAAAT